MISPTREQLGSTVRPTAEQWKALQRLAAAFDVVRYEARMPLGTLQLQVTCRDRGRVVGIYRVLTDGTVITERTWA